MEPYWKLGKSIGPPGSAPIVYSEYNEIKLGDDKERAKKVLFNLLDILEKNGLSIKVRNPEPEPLVYSMWTMERLLEDIDKNCVDKKRLREILDEEVSKPESNKGMVGWTIPSFHQVIDSINIPQHTKNMIKSQCTKLLHKQGLKVDVADYHDRLLMRFDIDDK
jgi:hypothetical protein